jgi:hypothetical protein
MGAAFVAILVDGSRPAASECTQGIEGPFGPLDFDYLLKQGVANRSNTLAIARLAGVSI